MPHSVIVSENSIAVNRSCAIIWDFNSSKLPNTDRLLEDWATDRPPVLLSTGLKDAVILQNAETQRTEGKAHHDFLRVISRPAPARNKDAAAFSISECPEELFMDCLTVKRH